MPDKFKDFMLAQKEEFDFTFDAEKGWNDFQSRNNRPGQSKRWYMMAASVSILLLLSVAAYFYTSEAPRQLTEWEEAELFYQSQIDDMTVLVRNHFKDEEVLADLDEMDLAFVELKRDLKDNAANEAVIEAMMNHYRLKLRILEQMLDELKEENSDEKDISVL